MLGVATNAISAYAREAANASLRVLNTDGRRIKSRLK